MSRTSPLPSMHKFEKVGISEALKKQLNIGKGIDISENDINLRIGTLPNLVSQSRQATPEEERERIRGEFKTNRMTRKEREKDETFGRQAMREQREKVRQKRKGRHVDTEPLIFNKEKKEGRSELIRLRKEKAKQRRADRAKTWAQKQVLRGKFDSEADAMKRYETLKDMSANSKKEVLSILENANLAGINKQQGIGSYEDEALNSANEGVVANNAFAPMTDSGQVKDIQSIKVET